MTEVPRKRKKDPKSSWFHSFAANPRRAPTFPFYENISSYVQEWTVPLENKFHRFVVLMDDTSKFGVPLYIVTEKVRTSSSPFCRECEFAGWGDHLVSKRRYHFIIPIGDDWNKPLEDKFLEKQNHLLHGIFHSNGYGHLLCLNGFEGGSTHFSGKDIMDLWDRICTVLGSRKITVKDTSLKQSMDLRLLYGVAYEHPWFGRWRYRFCNGTFGVTLSKYNRAIKALTSGELDTILEDLEGSESQEEIKGIISHYRDISQTPLTTLKDLLKFMLTVKSCALPFRKPSLKQTRKPSLKQTRKPSLMQTGYKCARCKKFSGDVYIDIVLIYKAILQAYPNTEIAVRDILDSKRFVKEWELGQSKTLTCTLQLNTGTGEKRLPGVIVEYSEDLTFGKLKSDVAKFLKETYFFGREFMVDKIENFEETEDAQRVGDLIASGTEIFVTVMDTHLHGRLPCQRGREIKNVNCKCGALEDDGESMLKCTSCTVWQHHRCLGIDDVSLKIFFCSKCEDSSTATSDPPSSEASIDIPRNSGDNELPL